ncbi:hypothetical protein D7X48_06320 [bacterium D16-50]|nr:hypothetical protein D7X48_06320 [bacterium D16-50]
MAEGKPGGKRNRGLLTGRGKIWYTDKDMQESICTVFAKKQEDCNRKNFQEKKGLAMLVNFLNSFMSYLVLMLVIVVIAGVAIAIGVTMARRKANKAEAVGESGADAAAGK